MKLSVSSAIAMALIGAVAQAAPPGTLVSADPVVDTPAGMQAWKVRYWTTSDRGAEIEATGMVVAPREAMPVRPRRVVAWTHGTWGISEGCAPSASPNFYKATAAIDAVSRGYVVVAPDYPGLGSAGPHGFLVGEAAARATLDAVRAAKAIPGAAAGSDYAVWGESQGGHAALWTARRAAYAPELRLTGVAAIVPPTDLVRNLREARDPSARAFFTAYVVDSWSAYYGIPVEGLVKRPVASTIRKFGKTCVVLGARPKLAAILGILQLRAAFKTVDLGARQPWARYARTNSVAATSFGVPVLIATSDGDALVSPVVVRDYARRLCAARGGPLRYIHLKDADHPGTAKATARDTLDWIDARFAGRSAPSDCGRI